MSKIPEWAEREAAGLWVSLGFVNDRLNHLPTIALALVAAEKRGADAKEAEIAALLKYPAAVRVNYLRGGIACQPLIDEAEKRGIERAASKADEIAAGRSRQKMQATTAKKRSEARDFESMAMSAIDVSYAIRQLGESHDQPL